MKMSVMKPMKKGKVSEKIRCPNANEILCVGKQRDTGRGEISDHNQIISIWNLG